MSHRDPWEKPRSYGNHLSQDEIDRIRAGFDKEEDASIIARELKCATRTVNVWFSKFRGDPKKCADPRFATPVPERTIPTPNALPWCLPKLRAGRA